MSEHEYAEARARYIRLLHSHTAFMFAVMVQEIMTIRYVETRLTVFTLYAN
jgi:hypothetical protein